MKATTTLTFAITVGMAACTTYPKNYTYSPTVTISGNNEASSPLILPNPFSKTPRSITTHNVNYNTNQPLDYNREETFVFIGQEYLEAQ